MYPSNQSNQTNQMSQPNSYSRQKKSKQDALQDFIREHRNLSMVIILAIFGVLLTIIVLIINFFSFVEPNGNTVPEIAPYAYFEHSYLIESSLGQSVSNQVLLDVTNIIVSSEEIDSAPAENSATPENQYTVDISEESYRRSTFSGGGYVFDVTLSVSDGRQYDMYILIDENYGQYYIAVIFDRADSAEDRDYIITYMNDPDTYSSVVNKWVNTYNLNNPETLSYDLPNQNI